MRKKPRFQTIEIYDSTDWGKLMVIDGCTMVTTRDNFLYHEMMSHPALFTHPRAKRVVIIGGGDCGTLREVLKHDEVESAVQVEIDERVTRLAEQYFPELCESNKLDPRAQLLFIDGIQWMADCEGRIALDVIIVDSTDPIGPAEGLFNEAFYQSCLKRAAFWRHPGATKRIAAGASAIVEIDSQFNEDRRLPGRAHADVPATVLSDRLVERDDGTQGRGFVGFPRTRRRDPAISDALLQRRDAQGRAGDAGISARSTGGMIRA